MAIIPDLSRNERLLIEIIFAKQKIARIDLAKQSGMTGATVTRLTAGLIDLGLLTEEVDRIGTQGQPKRLLRLQPNRILSAGITFSIASMEVVIINIAGTILNSRSVGIAASSAEAVAHSAQAAITSMLIDIEASQQNLLGIGCSVPGNFGTMSNIMKAHMFFPAFENGEVVKAFDSIFAVPYYLENDGTAAAMGEYFFGHDVINRDPMFFIHIGHGVGGGAVIGGHPYRGVNGNACLPGVLFPYDLPRPSGQDLLSFLASHGFLLEDFGALNALSEKAQPFMELWVERASEQLRFAIRAVTGFFDPAVIIIGGRLPETLNHQLVDRVMSRPIEGPSRGLAIAPVRASHLGVKGGAIGAACIPLFSQLFSGTIPDAGNLYLNGRV